jgi:predicted SAM-dependent methyltransferase
MGSSFGNYLNLGCGDRYHPDWTNVDIVSTGESVIAHDLTQGIPFPDASFDVVYHSHVIEHIPKTEAESFLKECYRVLRPQGVLRVVFPDLEQIAKTYLMALEKASNGSQEWADNYEWIMLEMYDMTVRNDSGGEMVAYLARKNIAEEFVKQRCGISILNWREDLRKQKEQLQSAFIQDTKPKLSLKKFNHFLRYPSKLREILLKNLLGKEYRALQIGRLRQSGELHQWMYDRYSLTLLLEKIGLDNIVQRSAHESYLPNWTSFNLDTEPDGRVYKPDSLYMEAIKPPV